MATPVHSMIRVLNEKRSIDFYSTNFDLNLCDRYEFDDFALIYLRNKSSSFELELTINFGRDREYEMGDGYGHLAVVVDDVDSHYERLVNNGLNINSPKDFMHNGKRLARFFFVTDPDGYKIEVIQRDGRFS
ncbi:VOC family protein [Brucella grignonensis]|nr:VOC family protein [Brucella grignonensis]NKB84471.1 lactoylglutathione lyase [Brucella grignonensis]